MIKLVEKEFTLNYFGISKCFWVRINFEKMKNTKKAFLAIGNCKLNKNTNVLLFTNRFQTCKQIGVGNIFSTPHSFQFSFQLTQKRTHFSFNYTPKNKIQVRKSPLPHLPPFNQTLTFAFTPGHIYL